MNTVTWLNLYVNPAPFDGIHTQEMIDQWRNDIIEPNSWKNTAISIFNDALDLHLGAVVANPNGAYWRSLVWLTMIFEGDSPEIRNITMDNSITHFEKAAMLRHFQLQIINKRVQEDVEKIF